MSWSSGKDSAWALHLLRQKADLEVVALFTTFNCNADRVAMHAVRRELVQMQAERLGLPLWTAELPWPCANGVYEELTSAIWKRAIAEQVSRVAFGDLFLEDVRAYREEQRRGTGLSALFPLWGLPTDTLAAEMIASGVKAKITCLDPAKLGREFAGCDFCDAFVRALPSEVDPCGERGEFHTFVYESPEFSRAIDVERGEIVERDGFVFADLKHAES